MTSESHGAWYYEQIELGYNYRLTDLQAALGLSQLLRIDGMLARRRDIAAAYGDLLAGLPLQTQKQHPASQSAWHLFVIRLQTGGNKSRLEVFESMRNGEIGVNVHYIPVHLQPYYREKFGFRVGDFPEAERYYAQALTLPLYPGLTTEAQSRVVATLVESLSA